MGLKIWPFQRGTVEGKTSGGRHIDAAADVLKLAGKSGKRDDGLDGAAATIRTLDAIVDADDSGVGSGKIPGETFDGFSGDTGELCSTSGRHGGGNLPVLVEVVDVLGVGCVFEMIPEDDVGQGERKGEICTGVDRNVLVSESSGFSSDRVDYDEAGPIAAGLDDEGPEVDVGGEDVGTPGEDKLAVRELFGFCAEPRVHGGHESSGAG